MIYGNPKDKRNLSLEIAMHAILKGGILPNTTESTVFLNPEQCVCRLLGNAQASIANMLRHPD